MKKTDLVILSVAAAAAYYMYSQAKIGRRWYMSEVNNAKHNVSLALASGLLTGEQATIYLDNLNAGTINAHDVNTGLIERAAGVR